MECKDARLLSWFVRPGQVELEPRETAELQQHLQGCPECAAAVRAEARVDAVFSRAMQAVPIPSGLQTRLLNRLDKGRTWQRWSVRGLAMAAALLLMIGLGYYWFGPQPAFDIEDFVAVVNRRSVASPEEVETWFHEQHLAVVAPRQLNYRLLDSCDVVYLQGRRVPKLLFVHRGEGRTAVAHVYVLAAGQFNLTSRPLETVPTSSHTIEEKAYADIPGFVYLFVFTGESLDPFFAAGLFN